MSSNFELDNIISANLKTWCSKMQPLSGNQRPDLLTSLMSFVLRLPREMHLCRSSSNVPRLPSFLEMLQSPHVLLIFDKVHNPFCLPRKTTSERPKVIRTPQFFALLTSKCAARHNGVHFFDISTSKSGPILVCFAHFDLEMCFAPKRRALFRHLNFQKWSGAEVFCTFWLRHVRTRRALFRHCAFWLRNVLRATTACNFSSLIWPAGSAPAALASLLFDPPEPQIIGKNTVVHDFHTFSRICIFFLLTLSLLWSSLFYSPLLSASAQLCFSSVHIVESLTSNFPSTVIYYTTYYIYILYYINQ